MLVFYLNICQIQIKKNICIIQNTWKLLKSSSVHFVCWTYILADVFGNKYLGMCTTWPLYLKEARNKAFLRDLERQWSQNLEVIGDFPISAGKRKGWMEAVWEITGMSWHHSLHAGNSWLRSHLLCLGKGEMAENAKVKGDLQSSDWDKQCLIKLIAAWLCVLLGQCWTPSLKSGAWQSLPWCP